MSSILFRNFSRLRDCLVISTRIRQLKYYSGKSLLDRYNGYPLMPVSTEALHRGSLIGIPWNTKCHANFSSASEKNDESQCKRHHELDRTGQPVKVQESNLTIKKILVTCKGTTMSVEEVKLLKMEIKFKILISLTVHMCGKDEKVGTEADGVDKELAIQRQISALMEKFFPSLFLSICACLKKGTGKLLNKSKSGKI